MKITKSSKTLLMEAYRRNEMFVRNDDKHELLKPLNKRWLGLGTKAAYSSILQEKLMVFHNGITPPERCPGWLILTDKGVEAMKHFEAEFKEILNSWKQEGYEKSILGNFMLAGALK